MEEKDNSQVVESNDKNILSIIQVSEKNSFCLGSSIALNNSIEVWYTLKTTIKYLQSRPGISKEERDKLDKAAAINLENISKYLRKSLGIQKEGKKIMINTSSNNNMIDNEIENQGQPGSINSVLDDIDGLVVALHSLNKNLNINEINNNGNDNDKGDEAEHGGSGIDINAGNKSAKSTSNINDVLGKYSHGSNSIDDVVFDELIKGKNTVLPAQYNFQQLKKKIEKKELENNDNGKNKDDDNINNDIAYDPETAAEARNKKVFFSRAAKEFQKKVSNLKDVQESKNQDSVIENYNKAVKDLDKAILDIVKSKAKDYEYSNQDNGIKNSDIPKLRGDLSLQEHEKGDENKKSEKKKKYQGEKGDENEGKEFVKDKDQMLKDLAEEVKKNLVNNNKQSQGTYIDALTSNDKSENSNLTNLLSAWNEKLNDLRKINPDYYNQVNKTGKQIKISNQSNEKGKKDDKNVYVWKTIASDKDIEKITQGYDEYNEFVAEGLFGDVENIDTGMKKFLNQLLLSKSEDDFKRAKGQLDGMVSKIFSNIKDRKQNGNNAFVAQCLSQVLPLGSYTNNTKDKDKRFFVPTFVQQLFKLSDVDMAILFKNLEILGKDKNFQLLLSNIMEDDWAVKMIQNNFAEAKKLFEKIGDTVTRGGKFKEEFWDNNLKGQFTEWRGRVMKNFAMYGIEALGGFAGGNILAGMAGLGLSVGVFPAILTWVIIAVTAIAIAVLVSLVMTLFNSKGIPSLVKGIVNLFRGDDFGNAFYGAAEQEKKEAQKKQSKYVQKICNAFLTFGADEDKLKALVQDSKKDAFDKKSSKGKFFNSMVEMKDFLKKNATGDLKKHLEKSMPFKILEGKNQQQAQNQNNENIDVH